MWDEHSPTPHPPQVCGPGLTQTRYPIFKQPQRQPYRTLSNGPHNLILTTIQLLELEPRVCLIYCIYTHICTQATPNLRCVG